MVGADGRGIARCPAVLRETAAAARETEMGNRGDAPPVHQRRQGGAGRLRNRRARRGADMRRHLPPAGGAQRADPETIRPLRQPQLEAPVPPDGLSRGERQRRRGGAGLAHHQQPAASGRHDAAAGESAAAIDAGRDLGAKAVQPVRPRRCRGAADGGEAARQRPPADLFRRSGEAGGVEGEEAGVVEG